MVRQMHLARIVSQGHSVNERDSPSSPVLQVTLGCAIELRLDPHCHHVDNGCGHAPQGNNGADH